MNIKYEIDTNFRYQEEFKNWGILTRHFITPHLFQCKFCDLKFNR